jgi:muramoyltetrapeptide carboxypeptidase
MAVIAMMATMTLVSCSKDDEENIVPTPEEQIVLNCAKPDYLKAGDRVAMISPSYFTPMETIEKAAKVLRSWGFEPVIGPNVDKVLDGKIGGTPAATRMWLAGKISRSIYEPSCDYH